MAVLIYPYKIINILTIFWCSKKNIDYCPSIMTFKVDLRQK